MDLEDLPNTDNRYGFRLKINSEEDLFECCEVDKSYQEKSGELYRHYREYCLENGEFIRSTSDFYSALEQAGYKKKRTASARLILGLQIKFDFLD